MSKGNKISLSLIGLLFLTVFVGAIIGSRHIPEVQADEAGNNRVYLTGYTSFVNEDSAVAIYRDSKTSTEFVCFRHTFGSNEAYSCTQLDPTKVVKP